MAKNDFAYVIAYRKYIDEIEQYKRKHRISLWIQKLHQTKIQAFKELHTYQKSYILINLSNNGSLFAHIFCIKNCL